MNDTTEMPVPAVEPAITKFPKAEIQILLVDDDPAIRQVLSRLLTDEDYLVLTADSGAEAIEMVETLKIDLVVLDLNLPNQDGLDALEHLMLKHPLLPIILIAAHPHQFFPALALGVGALLEKPLDFVQLFHTIHQLLNESDELRLARLNQQPGTFHFIPSNSDAFRAEQIRQE